MGRKTKLVLFFIIVFGLPVSWYLFLQFFGENKFQLQVLDDYNISNCEFDTPALITRDDLIQNHPNQFERISKKMLNQQKVGFFGMDESCLYGHDMLLVDGDRKIRGFYQADRKDVDRMLAEVDIFIMNLDGENN